MNRRTRWLVPVGIGLGAAVLTFAVASSRRTLGARRVGLIGDSYAVGLGPPLSKLLPQFRYAGIIGTGTAQWATTIPDWTSSVDIVLVSLGVNDGPNPQTANYRVIVHKILSAGVRPVWIEPPANVSAVNTANTRRIVESLGIPVVPATQVAVGPDGLHPVSYGDWAKQVAKSVEAMR